MLFSGICFNVCVKHCCSTAVADPSPLSKLALELLPSDLLSLSFVFCEYTLAILLTRYGGSSNAVRLLQVNLAVRAALVLLLIGFTRSLLGVRFPGCIG